MNCNYTNRCTEFKVISVSILTVECHSVVYFFCFFSVIIERAERKKITSAKISQFANIVCDQLMSEIENISKNE